MVAKIALYWGSPGSSTGEESAYSAEDSGLISRSGRSPGEGTHYSFQYSQDSLVAQMVKKFTCNAGDLRSIPGLERSPGERDGNLLQYSCLENSMDRGAWQATVHGAAKSWTRLSTYFILTFSKSQNNLVPPSYHSVLPAGRTCKETEKISQGTVFYA